MKHTIQGKNDARDGPGNEYPEKEVELQELCPRDDRTEKRRPVDSTTEELRKSGGRKPVSNSTPNVQSIPRQPLIPSPSTRPSLIITYNRGKAVPSTPDQPPRPPEEAYCRGERILHFEPPGRFVPASKRSGASLQACCQRASTNNPSRKMGLEKSQRILILLAIDTVFFFVELITGYAVHSLALVADAFHMLNDVLSLCVGYWAVKIAQSGSSNNYTYGWQRAETLGALVNGVFLVALCVTIFLEAIQRFVEKPNVSNPKLVLIVGCVGLASNILGLFLFHEHSHGPGGHSHGDEEQGHAHAGHTHSHAHGHGAEDHDHADHHTHDDEHHRAGDERSPLMAKSHSHDHASKNYTEPDGDQTTPNGVNGSMRRKSVSGRRRRQSAFGSVENINFHPASFRNDIIQAARLQEEDIQEESERPEGQYTDNSDHGHGHSHNHRNGSANKVKNTHKHHKHNQPKEDKKSGAGHGHSHEDLNMKGVFLHVMGDALGNIGVIVTALIIWLAKFPGRFYFDPAISLVITVIILTSAIPLCKAASRILLQAVPTWVSIDEIREDIQDLEQVIEVHHLHVWQLSGDKLVASLHVKVNCEVQGEEYMRLAREIRACLHGHGIHSSTIQPEFMKEISGSGKNTTNASGVASPKNPAADTSNLMAADGKAAGEECALECGPECDGSGQCCPRGKGAPGEGLMR